MYLKSLEIQGFKSFPDKISLTFDKGLTAVVGPNGSGKSNIGDSVRWVLGEQSTKTLRGNKMEDVIFSGTVARKPMGFAAVTLNIDNTDKTLPDYGEEVGVTRKLYRSGESEYLINGKQVRLKDINELFMDTGLGRDGYSIIGQGRIAEIVGAKSNERRDIFEEAAGISKIRYKKHEAEKKLSAAQENILRLSDIISELESRVEPLRIQSQKAEKFVKLAEKRKRLEISVWVNRLDEIKIRLDEFEEKILVNKTEYENIENDIAHEEEKIQLGYRKMQESTIEADRYQQKILEEEQSASNVKSDIAVYENDIKHSNDTIASIKERKNNEAETKKKIAKDIKAAEEKLYQLELKRKSVADEILIVTAEFQKLEAEAAELGKSFDKAGNEINALYIKESECRFTLESAQQSIEDANQNLKMLEMRKNELDSGFADYEKNLSELEERLNKSKGLSDELKNKLNGYGRLYKTRQEGFENAKVEFEKVLFELKEKQQKKKLLSDLENNMEGFAGSVKNVLKASKQGRLSGVYGTVAQNISVESEYAAAIEAALGGAMQNIIVENDDIAKRCIRYLKEQRGGRATFLPLTSVKGYELKENGLENQEGFINLASRLINADSKFSGIIFSLLGRTAVAEDIDAAAIIAKKYGYKFRIVTLDGQIINAGGSFTGGSMQKSAGVITRKNEIEKLDAAVEELSVQRDKLRADAEKLRSEAEKLRLDAEGAKEKLNENEREIVRIQSELSSVKALSSQSENQLAEIERQINENNEKAEKAGRIIKETNDLLTEYAVKIKLAEEKAAESEEIKNRLRQQREDFSSSISRLKISEAEVSKDCEAQLKEIDNLKQSEAELGSNSDKLDEEIEIQKKLIEEKNRQISERREQLESFKENTSEYREQIKRWQNIHTEQSRMVKDIQQGLKSINDAKEKLSGEIMRIEERRNTSQRDYDSIIKQLFEAYELTRSEAVRIAEKLDDAVKAQRELADIKNKIRALGNVNVGAIEEYKEVSERYRFMSEQLADVQSSKKELEKIISELTEDMCRIFSESFKIINSNFKAIFVELFGGGHAELILTEPDNVLESGIEISVAPPGKVIKNLISLSGGEQSFIAIAIYFAILKLRPAPFCILDEIDAALDEVNVRKYAQYLKKFTDTTQFVLVTHRRSAMEEANVLYGVTMQEDGISKLLKMEQVDFQEEQ